ncbi:unnamed protein product [Mycena citricolor]|uniref:Uncharacterized protein n=1 Tax=Mycena citricolor TaxID=2018698 RepID=A0AAD2K4D7_9AGAR|nr:unnamed protein product [Mycena citricolor]
MPKCWLGMPANGHACLIASISSQTCQMPIKCPFARGNARLACPKRRSLSNPLILSLLAILTNILNKEESVEAMKSQGILGPDGQPNTQDMQWKTIPEGAATTVAAALDPLLDASPGAYLDDSVVANDKIEEHSADPANAAKLWDVSEEIVRVKFTFE